MARAFQVVRKNIPLCLVLCALAFSAGWLAHGMTPTGAYLPVDPPLRAKGDYKYINRLLACGTWESADSDQYSLLKRKVENFLTTATNSGKVSSAGIYFRELQGGRWFGINENAKFSPASLLKVPIMIAYLKSAEKQSKILDAVLAYDGTFDLNKEEYFRSPYWIGAGNGYKVSDLMTAMIVNSDNNATSLLFNAIDQSSLAEVFTDLGLSIPADNTPTVDDISPKSFSYFFRVLYNATYLNEEFSEKALDLLGRAQFPRGIQAGVPSGTTTAQKFGERSVLSKDGTLQYRELHDCGIVYSSVRPYVLCIMTRGNDFNDLVSVIQNVSAMTYEEVTKGR